MEIVKFLDFEDNVCYGIFYQGQIICGCCGGVFDEEDVKILNRKPDTNLTDLLTEVMEE